MDRFALKSCFIFDPNLKPKKVKPSDEESQDAKIIIYYPSSEENLIKRSNIGIIEGTLSFMGTFNKKDTKKQKDKLLFTELNRSYFIAHQFEVEIYIVLIIEKSNSEFKHFESAEMKKKFAKNLIKNFYRNFYLFHGSIKENFCPNGNDLREDQTLFQNLSYKFSAFISSYFDNFSMTQSPFLDSVLYSYLGTQLGFQLMSTAMILKEKTNFIELMAIIFKGRIIYNEIEISSFSLLYNMLFNNMDGKSKFDQLGEPLVEYINDDPSKGLVSPFKKGFDISNNFNIGFLIGINGNTIYLPTVYIKETQRKYKLCVYNEEDLTFFLLLNNEIDYSQKRDEIMDISMNISAFFFIGEKSERNKSIINFEIGNHYHIGNNIHFAYFNEDNHCFVLSKFFYDKKTDLFDSEKIDFIQLIYEVIHGESKNSIFKLKGMFLYYFSLFEKKLVLLLKDELPFEVVKQIYMKKVFDCVKYL